MNLHACCRLHHTLVRRSAKSHSPQSFSSRHPFGRSFALRRRARQAHISNDGTRRSASRCVHTAPVWRQWQPPHDPGNPKDATDDTIRVVPSDDEGQCSKSIPLPVAHAKDAVQRMAAFQSEKVEPPLEDEWTPLEADTRAAAPVEEDDLPFHAETTVAENGEKPASEAAVDATAAAAPTTQRTTPEEESYVEPPYRVPPLPCAAWHDKQAWLDNNGSVQTMDGLLFDVCPACTTVCTSISPVDRVEFRTPLYDWRAKESLFYKTKWLEEMSQWDLSGRADVKKKQVTEPSSQASSVPLEKPTVGPVPHVDNKIDANSTPTSLPLPPPPPTHQYIVGRPKVMRYLFFQFLKKQHLWMDSVDELLQRCAQEVVREAPGDAPAAEEPLAKVHVSPHLLHFRRNQIIFSSPHMMQKLEAIITQPSKSFFHTMSATNVWNLFVLHHRHNATLLPSPQRPPFSFGELRPTLAASDFGLLRYGRSTDETEGPPPMEDARGPLPDGSESAGAWRDGSLLTMEANVWTHMSPYEQNMLLFGTKSARVARAVMKSSTSGIHSVFVEQRSEEKEEEVSEAAEDAEKPALSLSVAEQIQTSKKEEEERRLGFYDVDRFYLGFVEPIWHRVVNDSGQSQEMLTVSLQPGRSEHHHHRSKTVGSATKKAPSEREETQPYRIFAAADKQSKASNRYTKAGKLRKNKTTSPSVLHHVYFSDGLFYNAHNGELEDAQLSQLWQSFQKSDTSVLLDLYMHKLKGLDDLRCTVAMELATQYAFLLLFFARDEVRAITSPKHTYYRLSFFHAALRKVMRTALALQGEVADAAETSEAKAASADPYPRVTPFEDLSPQSQCSFTFFGATHIPRATTAATQPAAPAEAGARTPFDLYDQLLTVYTSSGRGAALRAPAPHFSQLLPLQQLAASFCYAQNMEELVEEKWFSARGDAAKQAELRAQMEPVTFMVPTSHDDLQAANLGAAQRKLHQTIRRLQRHKKLLPPHVAGVAKRKRGRPRKVPLPPPATDGDPSADGRNEYPAPSVKKDVPSNQKELTDNGVGVKRKRGRPRKVGSSTLKKEVRLAQKRQSKERRALVEEERVKKKRGRPRKFPKPSELKDTVAAILSSSKMVKKRRGRPPLSKNKKKVLTENSELIDAILSVIENMQTAGRLPGQAKKKRKK